MDVLREEFTQAFDGPLAEVTGLPTGLLYAVALTIAHLAGKHARALVTDALRPLLGEPDEAKDGWFSSRLRFKGQMPAEVRIGKDTLTLTMERRLRSQRVEELVHALATLPGASDLRLTAERRVFQEPGAGRGPPLE